MEPKQRQEEGFLTSEIRKGVHSLVDAGLDLAGLVLGTGFALVDKVFIGRPGPAAESFTGRGQGEGDRTAPFPRNAGAITTQQKTYPGETIKLPFSVENPGEKPIEKITFVASSLVGRQGHVIPADQISFLPSSISLEGKDFEKVYIQVQTSRSMPPGEYVGSIRIQEDDAFEIPIILTLSEPPAGEGQTSPDTSARPGRE